MEIPKLNKATRTFLINVLMINVIIWITGRLIHYYNFWTGPLDELETLRFPLKIVFLILSGIIFLIQAALLFGGKGRHFLFPVFGVLLALIYYVINFYFRVILELPYLLDYYIKFGDYVFWGILFLRFILLIKNRY
jgi:hypothetical protein